MFRFVVSMALFISFTGVCDADLALPNRDAGNSLSRYGLSYWNGDLYVATGDSIYRLDDPNGSPTFTLRVDGLRSQFGDGRAFDGGMAINNDGLAFVPVGFDGGALLVNLAQTTPTVSVVSDFNHDGVDDNLADAAAGPDGNFYTMWVAPDYSTATLIYRYDPTTGNATQLVDAAPGDYSGGVAFDLNGNLYASTYTSSFQARFSKLDLSAAPVTSQSLLTGDINTNTEFVFDDWGNLYINGTTGIGRVTAGETTIENIYGDMLASDVFSSPSLEIKGMTYDPVTDQLVFAQQDNQSGTFYLRTLAVPEPTAAMMLLGGWLLLAVRRRDGVFSPQWPVA